MVKTTEAIYNFPKTYRKAEGCATEVFHVAGWRYVYDLSLNKLSFLCI